MSTVTSSQLGPLSALLVASRPITGHDPGVPADIREPPYDELLADLRLVRERGLGNLRRYGVPALHAACRLTELSGRSEQEPVAVETLLRHAVETLGGGRAGEAAEYSLGLVRGTKLWSATDRRKAAAKAQGVSTETFRKTYEKQLLEQVAEGVLAHCHQWQLRTTRLNMERRHPADSRLAVQWVERFEAYYRIWTPVWALAADLGAAVTTRRTPGTEHPPWAPDSDEPYEAEDQARGYGRFALYAYASYQLELRKFMTRHGGLWLLSDAGAEQQAADAIYRIGWQNPLNEDDNSWLRRQLADARHEEPQHFAHLVSSSSVGMAILTEWQDYVASCACPINRKPEAGCQVHAAIQAAHDYCDLIDADWLKIADWYHPGSEPSRGVIGESLYERYLAGRVYPQGKAHEGDPS